MRNGDKQMTIAHCKASRRKNRQDPRYKYGHKDKNSWANPKSPHFDKEMYDEADNYSIRLARKYKLEGRGDEVGTEDFFNEITDYIKDSYDISTNPQASNSKPQSRDRMQMKTDKSPPVGSVTRQTPINQPSSKSRDIVLTPEQKEIARKKLAELGVISDKNEKQYRRT